MLATFNQLQPIGELPDNYFLVIILGFLGGGFLVLIVGLSYLYFKQKNTDSFSESKKETLTYKEAINALNALGGVGDFQSLSSQLLRISKAFFVNRFEVNIFSKTSKELADLSLSWEQQSSAQPRAKSLAKLLTVISDWDERRFSKNEKLNNEEVAFLIKQVHGFLNEVMVLAPQKEEEIS